MVKEKAGSIINIHLRPNISKLLLNNKASAVFTEYCEENYVGESVACYKLINQFKSNLSNLLKNDNHTTTTIIDNIATNTTTTNKNRRGTITANNNNNNNSSGTSNLSTTSSTITTTTAAISSSTLTTVTSSLSSINNNDNNQQQQLLKEEINNKNYLLIQEILNNYIKQGSEFEVNIDSQTRRKTEKLIEKYVKCYINNINNTTLTIDKDTTMDTAITTTTDKVTTITNTNNLTSTTTTTTNTTTTITTEMTIEEQLNIFKDTEFQILLMLNGDVLPRFVRSQKWHDFILENNENQMIATQCCNLEDLELVQKLKYTRNDLKRKLVLMKDIQFADMVCLDYSCFEYLEGKKDINVYFCPGDIFIDTTSINIDNNGIDKLGKSNIAKTIGYLPFAAEVVISCLMDDSAIQKIYPTTVFDEKNELHEIYAFLSTNEEMTANMVLNNKITENGNNNNNGMTTNMEESTIPSRLAKYHVKIGPLFDLRTNYVVLGCIYYNLKYYFITKGIYNEEEFPNEYLYYNKNKKLKKKKTVTMVSISIHVITPIGKDKCHYIHFASGNLGGIFTKITTLSLFKKLLGKVSLKSRETLISVINDFKKERYINIKNGYESARMSFEIFNKEYGIKEECPFPKTFEEFQEL